MVKLLLLSAMCWGLPLGAITSDYKEAYNKARKGGKKLLVVVEKEGSDFLETMQEKTDLAESCEETYSCVRLTKDYTLDYADGQKLFSFAPYASLTFGEGVALIDFANQDKSRVKLINQLSASSIVSRVKSKITKIADLMKRVAAQTMEQVFLSMINNHRALYGRSPLRLDPYLNGLAHRNNQVWASTRNPHGVPGGYSGWAGTSSVTYAFQLWRASPPHNHNMLVGGSRLGIGCSYGCCTFYVQ